MYLSTALTQTWGQLLSNVIDYITITLQFLWLHYITITSILLCSKYAWDKTAREYLSLWRGKRMKLNILIFLTPGIKINNKT
jgi:hypothetical protein